MLEHDVGLHADIQEARWKPVIASSKQKFGVVFLLTRGI